MFIRDYVLLARLREAITDRGDRADLLNGVMYPAGPVATMTCWSRPQIRSVTTELDDQLRRHHDAGRLASASIPKNRNVRWPGLLLRRRIPTPSTVEAGIATADPLSGRKPTSSLVQ